MPLKIDKLTASEIVLNGTELKPSYKVYTALLSQTGTNPPVATVLENTLGDIVWTYTDIGFYTITSVNNAFTQNKTYTFLQLWGDDNVDPRLGVVLRTSDSTLELFNRSFDGSPTNKIGDTSSGWLTSIEIRVYN